MEVNLYLNGGPFSLKQELLFLDLDGSFSLNGTRLLHVKSTFTYTCFSWKPYFSNFEVVLLWVELDFPLFLYTRISFLLS